ncbi:hypothetical protein [Delftia acidovorans]|uniref:hypothetical protein n=1 Tax=Delftia acidovorans TaxID=80866 RepID=UPI001EDE4C2D|nr:hypothetical protein [Delftia acidovorans]MCG3784622.1 hypothetical protein [Delftia acidovorans]
MTDIVSPTPIAALPPAPQPTDTPVEFNTKGFATVAAQVAMIPQINTAAAQTNQNAVAANELAVAADASKSAAQAAAGTATTKAGEAAASATASAGSATTASTSASNAAGSATAASGSATAAAGSATEAAGSATAANTAKTGAEAARDAAQGFRDQAAVFATQQIKGSSTTSVTPGAGAKSFTIEASRSFVTGMYVVATSTSDPATQMSGPVQSYNPTTGGMVIAVDMFSGASAKADWVIGVAAPGAATGLARQVVTANTTCVAGVAYIVAAAGITLTLPTTWAPGDRIAIIEAIGDGAQYSIAFGATKLRSRTMGTQIISAVYGATGVLTNQDATRGIV